MIAGRPLGSPAAPALPGLQFAQRPALFDALLQLNLHACPVLDITVGGRAAVLLTDADAVRALLRSGAPKGRPRATLEGVPGYLNAEADARRSARGAVKAALGMAAATAAAIPDDPDVAVAVLAHLSGAAPGPELRALARDSRTTLRAAVDRPPEAPQGGPRAVTDPGPLREQLATSAFVTALRERGWDDAAIAGEIMTLTFAGWASIAAVVRTAETLGVGGLGVVAADVDELLRLAPPGWLITREIAEPLTLAGRPLTRGTLVVTSPWLLHRDTSQWAAPERYDARRADTRSSPSYLPFGLGEWACPAEAYSRAVLLELLRRRDAGTAAETSRPVLIDGRSACLTPAGTELG